ncbi:NAD(P)/FAD-dependent oxidoreductase [Streptomyces sp. ISL-98]|uniref:FAD-dependent oxidoreductase n=1 Tax=Streptomyces sp. ISL-98 TaxID=2819192 RepID=UPI001BEA348C|nr:FAD-dependent oxidoreductase [Streptomyces sp. ISL-98]MBT2509720.1 NAD(P)/FAD-dependent oxidoreductase [Streptomyces sp. ISL-98]
MSHVLIVGYGPAAHRLAERIRHHGHDGAITTLGAEPEPAYHRPLLPSVVAGQVTPTATHLPPLPETRVHLGTVVTGIDREQRQVRAQVDGAEATYPYDTLVLATGARPRIPNIPGVVGPDGRLAPGVTTLRTATDCDQITGETVVVLGGGPLGVETASALAARGTSSTLVCDRPHPLYERLGETCSSMLTERLEQAGVTVLGGNTAVRHTPGHLRLDDGTMLRADTLVLCTGATPNTRLAHEVGLKVRDGVVVDDQLRTSDPHIHAIGDCAEHDGQTMAGINAAWKQAEALAKILSGRPAAYQPAPSALRLRTHVADVSCIGSPDDLEQPGTRLVTLTDHTNRRYARLTLRDERVVGAVLFGLPQAIATIGFLHKRRQRLPSDRLGLLLGLPPRPTSDSTEASEDALICLCNNVTKQTLIHTWQEGSRTVTALAAATRATTGCGGCSQAVEELCGIWAREIRNELEKAS